MFAIFLKLSVIFIFALPGVIAFVLYPGHDPRMTFAVLLSELMPSGLRGLILAALIAAIVSSLDGVMNSISTLVVRDFVLRFHTGIRERTHVLLGRLTILFSMMLGIGAAYLVYITPGGVYKYFQTLGAYLFIPITPAIVFGIMSRRVTVRGAAVSVIVGVICSAFFLADEFMGPVRGAEVFPWLHTDLTTAYSYRGLWGFLLITAVLFGVSALTEKTAPEKLEKTTVDWSIPGEPFAGWSDWRLHFAGLTVLTAALYAVLW